MKLNAARRASFAGTKFGGGESEGGAGIHFPLTPFSARPARAFGFLAREARYQFRSKKVRAFSNKGHQNQTFRNFADQFDRVTSRSNFMRIFSKAYIPVSLVVVLALSLLLRMQTFRDFPFYNMADYNRDYMVTHYMVADGEYPHAGPGNPFAKRATSPAYYYLMAAPLLIKDNIVTLGIFNVILQLLTLVLVFMFAKRMFGAEVALIATVIFGFAEHILNQSAFPWQPHTMQPFLVLSYLLLVFAYQKKSFAYLLSSIPFFSCPLRCTIRCWRWCRPTCSSLFLF